MHNKDQGDGSLPQPPGFALPLKQSQDISLSDWALDVADNGTVLVVQEFNADLGHVAGAAGLAEHPALFSSILTQWM